MVVVTWQNVGCLADPSAPAHKHHTESQDARCGATDVSKINKKRDFLKSLLLGNHKAKF